MTTSTTVVPSREDRRATKKWLPPLRTIEEVTKLLKPDNGPRLNEIKLCWRDPQLQDMRNPTSSSATSKAVLHKKKIAALEKALKKSPSKIERISVGWKHGDQRKSVIQLLQVFIHQAKAPALQQLQSMELVLVTWIPDTVLLQLLLPHAHKLRSLHIQATRIKVRTKPKKMVFKNTYQSVHAVDSVVLQEESAAKILATPRLADQLTNLTSLKFIDADVLDPEVNIIVRFLWRHYSRHGIEHLSLRSNRHMTPAALKQICQAPVSKTLDLSLCNIKILGAKAIADALGNGDRNKNHSWRQRHGIILQELALCGNYQLDEQALIHLCQVCPYQVRHWNLSYCDMNEHKSLVVLRELTPALVRKDCPLTELTLQGSRINNSEACRYIQHILKYNRSLTALRLDDPKYPHYLPSKPLLETIVQGLHHNYGVQELTLDVRWIRLYHNHGPPADPIQNEMDFYLYLNRAGRKLLQANDDNLLLHSKEAWIETLVKARHTGRMDVLYWLVRNGVMHLF
ncbi:expressed unknown protein [Seminavis robusta]|uniref:RNI-like protein n=1 Tax=Seminavis robusta TaxID=568900 RepID=A0A9N8EPR2_9STRA|nr:expressed unknown protein [Seminavis robusta]|eukprot:Sro1507_g278360.1 n/a (513) ;mRNA; r:15479-17017